MYTSAINPSDSNPIVVARERRETEEHLRASGTTWTMLRNSIYTEVCWPAPAPPLPRAGTSVNEGHSRASYVARGDCAAVAAAVHTTDGHDGKEYDITRPDALCVQDVTALYTVFGDRVVEAVLVDDEAYTAALVEHAGLPERALTTHSSRGRHR